jgi:hypothetical protein
MNAEMGDGVRTLSTTKFHVGTQPAVSLPWRNAAENEIGTTGTCATSSATETHLTELKTGAKNKTTRNKSGTMKGIMTVMIPSTTSLTDNVPQKEDTMKEG